MDGQLDLTTANVQFSNTIRKPEASLVIHQPAVRNTAAKSQENSNTSNLSYKSARNLKWQLISFL